MKYLTRFKTHSRPPRQHRTGSIIVLTAVSMTIMLIFAALLVDVAWMSTIQTEAQLASDIATRGALASFLNDRSGDTYSQRVSKAQAVGETIFENTVVGRSGINIDPNSFVFGLKNDDGTFSESEGNFSNAVQLNLPNVKPDGFALFLAPLFGINEFNTSPKTTVTYSAVDVVLCLDISRSMAWRLDRNSPPDSVGTIHAPPVLGSRWIALVNSVNAFLQKAEEQAPSLRIGLITIGGGVRTEVDTPWDTTATRVQNELDFVGAAGKPIDESLKFISSRVLAWQTPTKEALELTRTTFQNESFKSTEKICIVLSDGRATTGSPVSTAEALDADGVTVHTIYFAGDPPGVEELTAVSDAGGGLFLNANDATELDEAFTRILATLAVSIAE